MALLEDIEAHVCSADLLNDIGVPSASIAILDDPSGRIEAHNITNGHEDIETVYQACSISKAITALALAKLVDQGRISYETKAIDHVPTSILHSISDSRTEHFWQHVTVAHLVSHHSGISRHGMIGYEGEELPTYEQMFAGTPPANNERIRFLSFPGSQFSYSGAGFTLLQLVLENALGMPFAQLMQETVLGPLGMSRSRYGDLPASEHNYAKAHYTAHTLGTSNSRGYYRFMELAAAGLWTTPSDLLRAMAAIQKSLQGGGDVDGREFLSKDIAKKMLTIVEPQTPDYHFALGWGADGDFIAHAGQNFPGYFCYVVGSHGRSVNEGLSSAPVLGSGQNEVGRASVAIMTSSDLGWPALLKLMAAIWHAKGWPRYSTLPSGLVPFTDFVPLPAFVKLHDDGKTKDWQSWVGKWSHGWEVCDQDGSPAVLFEGFDAPMKLLPAAVPWQQMEGEESETTLVVDGLEIALRLTFEKHERVIEVVQTKKQVIRRI